MKNLAVWIRDMLKRHAKNPVSEITTLDELKEYFADESGEGSGKGTEEVDPNGKIIIRAKPLKQTNQRDIAGDTNGTTASDGEGGSGKGGRGSTNEPGNGTGNQGEGRGDADADNNNNRKQAVSLTNIRAISSGKTGRTLSFTPTSAGRISVGIMEAGADSDYEIAVIDSNMGEVSSGRVLINVKPKIRITLQITLAEAFLGALKVVAHEV